jgi:Na+-translocating ferredoxin:NAD+ oxidoreductase RnfE subunit
MSEIKDVIVQGLWKNNSALVQLLGKNKECTQHGRAGK